MVLFQAVEQVNGSKTSPKLKVLLIINECNPDWASVALVGYQYYRTLSQLADVTLVTHGRNKAALDRLHPEAKITYLFESRFSQWYFANVVERCSQMGGRTIWQVYNALLYPIYAEFNRQVYQTCAEPVKAGEYDIVHAITPMLPRYPYKIFRACEETPFVVGPVNGGVPFPKGFAKIARQEFSFLNFLRFIGRVLLPEYPLTYKQARHVLAGSTYTLNLLKEFFDIEDSRISLFYENGITASFLEESEHGAVSSSGRDITDPNRLKSSVTQLLFVGRLVPYKGTDMLLEAISQLPPQVKEQVHLTIVGDGSERELLEQQTHDQNLQDTVTFTGWIEQTETRAYYHQSDIFCFPSIREFGGAVVMEAMAAGLPCIVVNNGGIGEYVTENTGFKIEPESREYVVEQLANHIEQLIVDPELYQTFSTQAKEQAKAFVWEHKAGKVIELYESLLEPQQSIVYASTQLNSLPTASK